MSKLGRLLMMRLIYGSKLSSAWPALVLEIGQRDVAPSVFPMLLNIKPGLSQPYRDCILGALGTTLGVVWNESASGYRLKPCQVLFCWFVSVNNSVLELRNIPRHGSIYVTYPHLIS